VVEGEPAVAVDGVGVGQPVGALLPLAADGIGVVLHVDERCGAGVRAVLGRAGGWVVDRLPLPVAATAVGLGAAALGVGLHGGPAVGRRGGAEAGERVEVGEVLLAAAVELDVRVAANRGLGEGGEGVGRLVGADGMEGVAAVDRAVPDAALGPGAGGCAGEDATLRVDGDVRLTPR